LPYYRKAAKNGFVVGGVGEFVGQILARPVLVVLTLAPEAGGGYVVNYAPVSHPDFVAVLAVAQGELAAGEGWFHEKNKARIFAVKKVRTIFGL